MKIWNWYGIIAGVLILMYVYNSMNAHADITYVYPTPTGGYHVYEYPTTGTQGNTAIVQPHQYDRGFNVITNGSDRPKYVPLDILGVDVDANPDWE